MNKLTLVSGFAGSGKTTFIKSVEQAYSKSIYHDLWVEHQYEVPFVQTAIRMLFPKLSDTDIISKNIVLRELGSNPLLNVVLSNYFKSKFCIYLSSMLKTKGNQNIIVEIPFIDENVEAIKQTYPDQIKIIWINSSNEIINRLLKRGWDDRRITLSLHMQEMMYNSYRRLIDDYV